MNASILTGGKASLLICVALPAAYFIIVPAAPSAATESDNVKAPAETKRGGAVFRCRDLNGISTYAEKPQSDQSCEEAFTYVPKSGGDSVQSETNASEIGVFRCRGSGGKTVFTSKPESYEECVKLSGTDQPIPSAVSKSPQEEQTEDNLTRRVREMYSFQTDHGDLRVHYHYRIGFLFDGCHDCGLSGSKVERFIMEIFHIEVKFPSKTFRAEPAQERCVGMTFQSLLASLEDIDSIYVNQVFDRDRQGTESSREQYERAKHDIDAACRNFSGDVSTQAGRNYMGAKLLIQRFERDASKFATLAVKEKAEYLANEPARKAAAIAAEKKREEDSWVKSPKCDPIKAKYDQLKKESEAGDVFALQDMVHLGVAAGLSGCTR